MKTNSLRTARVAARVARSVSKVFWERPLGVAKGVAMRGVRHDEVVLCILLTVL
jgi:hypothetical protein